MKNDSATALSSGVLGLDTDCVIPCESRQLSELERELGRPLYNRSHAGITPTEHGAMLAQYAESIIGLAEKAEEDIKLPSKMVSGTVHLGCGETRAMEQIADAMIATKQDYPDVNFKLYSGTTTELTDGLVRGQFDFLLECEVQPHVDMNVLKLSHKDRWGAIVRADDELANRDMVRVEDVADRSLITSRQGIKAASSMNGWRTRLTALTWLRNTVWP